MNPLISDLLAHDCKIHDIQEIKDQGIGSLLAYKTTEKELLKIDLLNQAKYTHWQNLAKQLFAEFEKHNIPFMIIKGYAYSNMLYSGSHIRCYSDLDIFVDKNAKQKASKLLESLGFIKNISLQGKLISQQCSYYLFDTFQSTIDLHWQINNKQEFYTHFQFQDCYSRRIKCFNSNVKFYSLDFVDSMLLSCFHYFGHKPRDRKHIWLYDIGLLWKSMSPEQKNQCIEKSLNNELSQILWQALALLSCTFRNLIPPEFAPKPGERSASYIANGASFKLRLKNTRRLSDKLLLIWELFFPDRNYLTHHLNLQSKKWAHLSLPRYWWKAFIRRKT